MREQLRRSMPTTAEEAEFFRTFKLVLEVRAQTYGPTDLFAALLNKLVNSAERYLRLSAV